MLLYLIIFYSGACCASFLTVCAWRLPQERSIIAPRSHCDYCGHQLAWFELIPLISFLVQNGRCRICGTPINPLFWWSELTGGLLACFILWQGLTPDQIYLLLILYYISLVDIFYLVLYPIPLFIALAPLFYLNWPTNHWLSALLIFSGLTLFAHLSTGFGMGDVELLTILALWFGIEPLLCGLLFSCLLCIIIYGIKKIWWPSALLDYQIPFIPYISMGMLLLVST